MNVGELRDQREGLVQLPGEGLAGMAVLGQPGREEVNIITFKSNHKQ